MSNVELQTIWKPTLAFVNALGLSQTLTDEFTAGLLMREGNFMPEEDITISNESKFFFNFYTNQDVCVLGFQIIVLRAKKTQSY